MFEHEKFDKYEFEDIPLDRDLYIMDESYMHEYEKSMTAFFEGNSSENVGYVGCVAARSVNANVIELSWYPNTYDRFHEVSIILPLNKFIACVGSWQCDEKPHIFVKSDWLEQIYSRSYSIFVMIDAIGVKTALEQGVVCREKLIQLRQEIDSLAAKHTHISFISFADSLLLKSNWSVGYFEKKIEGNYEPEIFINLSDEINKIYEQILGLSTYAVIAQGSNEYYEDALLHISKSKNHISLNSLGIPFAQLMEIENTARKAIKCEIHQPAELYMDQKYFYSLQFKYEFEKTKQPKNSYITKMMNSPAQYFYSSREHILRNLK